MRAPLVTWVIIANSGLMSSRIQALYWIVRQFAKMEVIAGREEKTSVSSTILTALTTCLTQLIPRILSTAFALKVTLDCFVRSMSKSVRTERMFVSTEVSVSHSGMSGTAIVTPAKRWQRGHFVST